MADDSNYWRLVLTLPINGSTSDAVTVHLHEQDDGREVYKVRQAGSDGLGLTFTTPKRAFSKAFELAAWPIRARMATARDFS